MEILLIALLCLFGAALVLHEVARLQQFAIRLYSKDAPEDAPVGMGDFVRGGNTIALRWLETLWVRRNGACLLCSSLAFRWLQEVLARSRLRCCADASHVRSHTPCRGYVQA